jgi:ubiquinone/menaquinone biosynthesis C-methylase UbiE
MQREQRFGSLVRRLLRALLHRSRAVRRLTPRQAYRRWSETYDAQPDNVVLALEADLFASLIDLVPVEGGVVIDVGCGTGRHWDLLFSRGPGLLHGIDSSPEMLARLRARYPGAMLHMRADARLDAFSDASADVVVSTLMLGHVRAVADELREWTRVLRVGGAIVLTDFHPAASLAGQKRTFRHGNRSFEVEHHVHTVEALRSLFDALGLQVVTFGERMFDPGAPLSSLPGRLRATPGTPLIVGFRLRKRA